MKDSLYFLDAQIICAVKDVGSIEAISKLLGIGEKSLNVYTKRAEQRLGEKLFIRNTKDKTIELNLSGLELYPICKNILELKNALDPSEVLAPKDIRGEVKITATQTILEYFHLPHLSSFVKKHPKITVNLNQLDDFYPVAQSINEIYFTVDIQEDTEIFSYIPYHDFVQKLWASESYLKENPKIEKFEDLRSHTLLFQLGYLTFKVMGASKVKASLPSNEDVGRSFSISGCRIVDKACESGLGIMSGSSETVRLSGLKVERVLPSYESDALTLYVKIHKRLLEKDLGRVILDWMFECRNKALETLRVAPSHTYKRKIEQ